MSYLIKDNCFLDILNNKYEKFKTEYGIKPDTLLINKELYDEFYKEFKTYLVKETYDKDMFFGCIIIKTVKKNIIEFY